MRKFLATLCLAGLIGAGAGAQVPGDPDVIEILMQDRGYPVRRIKDRFRDPGILSQVDGTRFTVFFQECRSGPCGAIQFMAVFDERGPVDPRRLNAWNRDIRFARAYADRAGDVVIQMDVSLTGDGIGRANFNDLLDRWRSALAQFPRYFN